MIVSKKDISLWLLSLQAEFREYLVTRSDPGRIIILREFETYAKRLSPETLEVAVVSGSESEPELQLLGKNYNVTLLNYEDDAALFDLTLDWSSKQWKKFHGQFDLVLCEQVLEHLPDPQTALRNLKLLLRVGGVVHLSTPALNNTHGEPYFYYSGFHPRTLQYFAEQAGFQNVLVNGWASNKGSQMYATCDWSPLAESGPLRFFLMALPFLVRKPKRLIRTAINRLRNMTRYPFQSLFSKNETSNYVVSWLHATNTAL